MCDLHPQRCAPVPKHQRHTLGLVAAQDLAPKAGVLPPTFNDLRCKLSDGLEGGQVQVPGPDAVIKGLPANVLCCCLTLLHISTGQNDIASCEPRTGKKVSFKSSPRHRQQTHMIHCRHKSASTRAHGGTIHSSRRGKAPEWPSAAEQGSAARPVQTLASIRPRKGTRHMLQRGRTSQTCPLEAASHKSTRGV